MKPGGFSVMQKTKLVIERCETCTHIDGARKYVALAQRRLKQLKVPKGVQTRFRDLCELHLDLVTYYMDEGF